MAENKIRVTYFTCGFCSNVIKVIGIDGELIEYPTRCLHCKVVKCEACLSFIPGDNPKFCYGCGAIEPKVSARMLKSDGLAIVGSVKKWQERNKGTASENIYRLTTDINGSMCLHIINGEGKLEKIRDLTEKEQITFKSRDLKLDKINNDISKLDFNNKVNLLVQVKEDVKDQLESAGFHIVGCSGNIYGGFVTDTEGLAELNNLPCVESIEVLTS